MTDFSKYIKLDNLQAFRASLVDHKNKDMLSAAIDYMQLAYTSKGKKKSILSSSTKWSKVDGFTKYGVTGLYLAPATHIQGLNTCRFSALCELGCIGYTGMLGFHQQGSLEWKTYALYFHTETFLLDLVKAIYLQAFKASIEGKEVFARLNGSSDIRWEKILDLDAMTRDFQGLKGFYDYTKYPRVNNPYQSYHLTYSMSETTTDKQLQYNVNTLGRVAIVVPKKDKLRLLNDYPTVFCDGDLHDMRPLDEKVFVLLQGKRATKKGKKLSSDFIESYDSLLTRLDSIGYMEGVQ